MFPHTTPSRLSKIENPHICNLRFCEMLQKKNIIRKHAFYTPIYCICISPINPACGWAGFRRHHIKVGLSLVCRQAVSKRARPTTRCRSRGCGTSKLRKALGIHACGTRNRGLGVYLMHLIWRMDRRDGCGDLANGEGFKAGLGGRGETSRALEVMFTLMIVLS